MKCAGKHLATDCLVEDVEIANKCYNCNGNHRANDPSCPVLIKYVNNKNKNLVTKQVNIKKISTTQQMVIIQ